MPLSDSQLFARKHTVSSLVEASPVRGGFEKLAGLGG
jgi:hypothetical protein